MKTKIKHRKSDCEIRKVKPWMNFCVLKVVILFLHYIIFNKPHSFIHTYRAKPGANRQNFALQRTCFNLLHFSGLAFNPLKNWGRDSQCLDIVQLELRNANI